jgi:hypothetical protein
MTSNLQLFEAIPLHSITTLGFYLAAAIYIAFTIIFYYHWNEYSVEPIVTKITAIAYLATTLPLIIIMGLITLVI